MANPSVCNCPPRIGITPCTGIHICGIDYPTVEEGSAKSGIAINRLRFLAQTPSYPEIGYLATTCPEPVPQVAETPCNCS